MRSKYKLTCVISHMIRSKAHGSEAAELPKLKPSDAHMVYELGACALCVEFSQSTRLNNGFPTQQAIF